MNWIEASPLPMECQNCREEECDNCDYAGKRWYLSREEELRLKRKGFLHAIERLQRQIQEIDKELLWIQLDACLQKGDILRFQEILKEKPEYAKEYIAELDHKMGESEPE